jgi:hypothetical protein
VDGFLTLPATSSTGRTRFACPEPCFPDWLATFCNNLLQSSPTGKAQVKTMRGRGETYSDVILRLAGMEGACLRPEVLWSALGQRVLTRSLGPFSIPSFGDGVMLGTAWIDRPVDTRGSTPASTSLPCSVEVQPCPCHLGRP